MADQEFFLRAGIRRPFERAVKELLLDLQSGVRRGLLAVKRPMKRGVVWTEQ